MNPYYDFVCSVRMKCMIVHCCNRKFALDQLFLKKTGRELLSNMDRFDGHFSFPATWKMSDGDVDEKLIWVNLTVIYLNLETDLAAN